MWGQRKRLSEDIRRWRSLGWVTADGEVKIRDELASRGGGVGLASVLGILASVLLGFAAISFVAAHWQDMPRLFRLVLLLGLIWAGYGLRDCSRRAGNGCFPMPRSFLPSRRSAPASC